MAIVRPKHVRRPPLVADLTLRPPDALKVASPKAQLTMYSPKEALRLNQPAIELKNGR
jgi:hypothetical protein